MNLYPLLADKIEEHPELLRTAFETLRRWQAEHRGPERRMQEWEGLLLAALDDEEGFRRLLDLLRDDSEAARRIKDFSPFAGLLSRDERRKAILSCSFAH